MPPTSTLKSRGASKIDRFAARASREAGRLARLALCLAIASLCSAGLLWTSSFSAYMGDSLRSFIVCFGILVALLVPGAILLTLCVKLRQLCSIIGSLPPIVVEEKTKDPEPERPKGVKTAVARCIRWLRSLWESATALWSAVDSSKDELAQAGASASTIAILVHPASLFAVAFAVLLSALLIVSASLSALWSVVSSIF